MAISIVARSAVVPIGQLNRFSLASFARRLKYAFDQADVAWVVGCFDYCVNFHEADRYEPHWSVHLHGFTVTDDQQALRRRLVEAVKKSDEIPRPVRVTPWDGSNKAIRYTFKTAFQRRQGIDNARRFNRHEWHLADVSGHQNATSVSHRKARTRAAPGSRRMGRPLIHASRATAQVAGWADHRADEQPLKVKFIVGPTGSHDRRAN